MNIKYRFKILIGYIIGIGIAKSQRDLSEKMGYKTESAFSQIINGKVDMPKKFIPELKKLVPGLNENWLLHNQGEMLSSDEVFPKDFESSEESTESILATIALGMQEERRRHDEHISNLLSQQERLIALLEKSNVRETDAAKCADAAS